jgi:AcrR family transcriptional regulator
MAKTHTEPRIPLNRERILHAALELADDAGIESLTMRKLGQTLGFEAMSLYNHVTGKDDVIDGMLDLVLAEAEPPASDVDWVDAVRASARSVHDALRKHRWAAGLLMDATHVRPARLRYMDLLLRRLREAGFDADTTYHAYHVLDGHICGFSLWENTHTYNAAQADRFADEFEKWIPKDEYPYLYEHGQQHFAEGPHRKVSAFEFGLDLILEGLKKLHDRAQ